MNSRRPTIDLVIAIVLAMVAYATAFTALRLFRDTGSQPSFYQTNFEPAVMLACGKGFVAGTAGAVPGALIDFLQLRSNTFDCSLLESITPNREVTWNATWYYLYSATALVWKITGISWTALDGLVAIFAAVASVALYGLFRLVSRPSLALATSLLLLMSPVNLTQLLYLRDYSKAPFVLIALLLLAWLVALGRPWKPTLLLAASYGLVVGIGYGFRSDLAVMVPFGIFVALFLLPGHVWQNKGRNIAAATVMLLSFVIFAWPALRGLSRGGGCQFHYALLGMTRPLTSELGMAPSIYQFGGHFLDTFVDLKTGDYASRVLGQDIPILCAPEYDVASGGLFWQMAATFPADLVAHAYGSVLMVLRAGLAIPSMLQPPPSHPLLALASTAYQAINAVTQPIAAFGLAITLLAIGMAWHRSVRLGITLTVFILFLTGYPAIEFEQRHWFHLRFIPWWAALFVVGELRRTGIRWERAATRRVLIGTLGLVIALVVSLFAIRAVQSVKVSTLIAQYLDAATENVPFTPGSGSVAVDWTPVDYALPPHHRASDLMVVTLDAAACQGQGPLTLATRYAADGPSHDIGTETAIPRPRAGETPTRVFIPVFWQAFGDLTYMKFAGLTVGGAAQSCIQNVARVTSGGDIPLWLEAYVPADWQKYRLYQTIRTPRFARSIIDSW